MKRDDLAARLLNTLAEELEEQTAMLNDELLSLEQDVEDQTRLRAVFRIAHTLKGAARAAGVTAIEELCHDLEALLAEARDGRVRLDAQHFALLFETADALAAAAGELREGRTPSSDFDSFLDLQRRLRAMRTSSAFANRGPRPDLPPRGRDASRPTHQATRTPPRGPEIARAGRDEPRHLRVHADKLDALLATAGQLLISTGRAESHAERTEDLANHASRLQAEWRRSWKRARGLLESAGTPARDLTSLDTIGSRIDDIAAGTLHLSRNARSDGARLWRVASDISERVRGLRMRPFADAVEALPRLVRDLAASTGKEVRLLVEGENIEADRAVLEGVREAIVQLVRNAVDHGLELPEHRSSAGKPALGTVHVRAELQGDGLRVTVADDGAGLNVTAVRGQLQRRGIPLPESDAATAALLFEGGVSTRQVPTEISGRGVGLDVVRSAVQRIRGSVDVQWREGVGSTFVIEAPLTLATLRVLLVRSGRHLLGVPTSSVDRLLHVRMEEIRHVQGRPVLEMDGRTMPLASIAALLGPPLSDEESGSSVHVAVLRAGTRRIAVSADELVSEQEIMLRPLERIGAPRIEKLVGAALLATGQVALVVSVGALLRAADAGLAGPARATPAVAAVRRTILVVDDSITTRIMEESVLKSAGYDVVTAVDGVEAWNLLQERGADLVVADVEMPRMDGFALCEAMRASRSFRDIPIVLVTTLETADHRQRGLDAGADAYIVKSSFDQEALIETIEQLLR